MEELKKKYDKIISLGSNCYLKFFLNHIKYSQETYFFDYLGSPMWSVYELIKNNFDDVFNFDDYSSELIIKGHPRISTNMKYNLKFKHSLYDLKTGRNGREFVKFKETYERRIKRFQELLSSSDNVLFIRFEEMKENRIINQSFNEKNKISELEYIKLFSLFITSNFPNLKFKILFISKTYPDNVDEENKIVIIKEVQKIDDYRIAGGKITDLLNSKLSLL
jgi:hypothetical protein